MSYEFDRVIDRLGTNSNKWRNEPLFGRRDLIGMWVADMDFPCPDPVLNAIKKRLEHPILGYYTPPESAYTAIVDRMKRHFDWTIKPEWIQFIPGVMPGVYAALRALTKPDDGVLIQSPVYSPFFSAIENTNRRVVNSPLRHTPSGYRMNFDHLDNHFQTEPESASAMILCTPHNPVGRVWRADELEALGQRLLENNCALISDDIHGDLIFGKHPHTVVANLSPALRDNTVTLMSTSKTYNTPALNAAFAIIPNPKWRAAFKAQRQGQGGVNLLGMISMEAALSEGDDYLDQLLDYIGENISLFCDAINRLPGLSVIPPEGTYLAWVDMRELGLSSEELNRFMIDEVRVSTGFGDGFGPGGAGFQRFNLACPRPLLEETIRRLKNAIMAC